MDGMIFLVLLTICSIVTGLVTQVWKKLTTKLPTNIEAFISGLVVGGLTGFLYMYFNQIEFTTMNIVVIAILGVASSFGATIGFDKVSQAITQIGETTGK